MLFDVDMASSNVDMGLENTLNINTHIFDICKTRA